MLQFSGFYQYSVNINGSRFQYRFRRFGSVYMIMVEGRKYFPSKVTNQILLRFFPQYIIHDKILKPETNVFPSNNFDIRKTKFLF